jgi:hypothetical protein
MAKSVTQDSVTNWPISSADRKYINIIDGNSSKIYRINNEGSNLIQMPIIGQRIVVKRFFIGKELCIYK